MEAFSLPLSRELVSVVAHILFAQALIGTLTWASYKVYLNVKAWFWGIRQIRNQLARLSQEVMSLRAETYRSLTSDRVSILPPAPAFDPASVPPPLPGQTHTYHVSDDDIKVGWEEDEDKTQTPG